MEEKEGGKEGEGRRREGELGRTGDSDAKQEREKMFE